MAETDEKREAGERIIRSLVTNQGEIEDLEKRLDILRKQRRKMVLLGRENGDPTYERMAEAAKITKSAVYKIVRDNFHEPRVSEWAEPVSA